jgi:signal recognition particle receptor subunit beta
VYFLLKSDVKGELEKVLDYLQDKMKDYCNDFDVTKSQPPSKVKQKLLLANKHIRVIRSVSI